MSIEIRRNNHSVSKLLAHLVFVVKYRRKVITDTVWETLVESFKESTKQLDVDLVEYNHDVDHVHLVVEYPPCSTISHIVGHLKGRSSFVVRRAHKSELQPSLWGRSFWTPSYFVASCGGAPIETLKLYVQNQHSNTALKGGVSTRRF